jgi:hypothetical protein
VKGAALELKTEIVGDRKLHAKLGKINRNLLTREIMGEITADAVTHIKDRTLEGKDKNNRPFIGYSDKYLEFKKKRGAKFFSGKVNLFDGGDMFSSMQHQVRTSDTAEIIFTRSPQALKASGHHNGSAKTGLPKRQFFSLGREGDKRAVKLLNKHLVKVLGA